MNTPPGFKYLILLVICISSLVIINLPSTFLVVLIVILGLTYTISNTLLLIVDPLIEPKATLSIFSLALLDP